MGGDGSTGPWGSTTGPAGFVESRWWAVLCRAVVPPFGPVLPGLRESEPNGQIFQGTYLRGLLPQWFRISSSSLCSIVANLESLIPPLPSNDFCPFLEIQERRSRSTIPPIHFSSK